MAARAEARARSPAGGYTRPSRPKTTPDRSSRRVRRCRVCFAGPPATRSRKSTLRYWQRSAASQMRPRCGGPPPLTRAVLWPPRWDGSLSSMTYSYVTMVRCPRCRTSMSVTGWFVTRSPGGIRPAMKPEPQIEAITTFSTASRPACGRPPAAAVLGQQHHVRVVGTPGLKNLAHALPRLAGERHHHRPGRLVAARRAGWHYRIEADGVSCDPIMERDVGGTPWRQRRYGRR